MKNAPILTISIFVYLLSLLPLQGQNTVSSKYTFSTITVNDGLQLNFIDNLFKDSRGFIWVSTQGGGLSRYDGYEFLIFNVNSTPLSLKSNFIRHVGEDNFKRLWVASNYGIDVIDLQKMSKSSITSVSPLFDKLLNTPSNNILNDSKGNLWIQSTEKVYKVEFDGKGAIKNIRQTASANAFTFTLISEIDNQILVANNGAIYKVSVDGVGELILTPYVEQINLGSNIFISAMLKKDNQLWVGSEIGLLCYNLTNQKLTHYVHNQLSQGSISQDMVTSIDITSEGVLVVGTLRGLNFFDPLTNRFEIINHGNNSCSLNSDFVNCILSDKNNLWIGTEAGGINKMTLRQLAIENYTHSNTIPSSLSANPVNAILEDHKGDLWVGTVEGGLNQKRKGENGFKHYLSNSGLSHNSVSTLEEDQNGNLWIGTWGGGVSILDLNKLPQILYKYLPSELSYIALLKYDPVNHGMWIGTNRTIVYYDILTSSVRYPISDELTKNILGVLGCMIDEQKQLWIGTSEGLIVIDLQSFDRTTFRCGARRLALDEKDVGKLFLKNMTTIYQSRDKAIWMGSNGYGICKLTPSGDGYSSQKFTVTEGLANNAVFSIMEDEQQLVWISTGHGLSCYNPKTNRFANYTKNDGLVNDQFYWNAGYKSPTSHNIYFGNMGGLTELKGSQRSKSVAQQKVTFTKLQVLNETVWCTSNGSYIQKDISYANRFDLHEQDRSFSIEFSALNYDNPSTVAYSYRLLGFDDKWIAIPATRRFVSYTNLSPGSYTLQVRSMTKADDWSDEVSEMEIVVHPFFYKTPWFILLCIFVLLFLSIQFYRWRVGSLTKQRKILHLKVEERTQALENQKKLLEGQAEELKRQNDVLVTQNEKISYQRKQLIDMADKVQEAMTDKISFFTNITHEFRTPITLIIGPIERALKLSANPKVVEQLQYVARNSKHLLSLVNQLMDFRKVESDSITIEPTPGNILRYIDEILVPFESFAHERNISIQKIYHLSQPYIMFDEEAMRKLITNLLSNAIKFTPDNGMVKLYLGGFDTQKTKDGKLYICVQDSGIGIKDEDLNRIFNRFYQSNGHNAYSIYGQSGTGIGLYLCKTIVNLQNGSIVAKNNHRKGASIRVWLPLIYNHEFETVEQAEQNQALPMESILPKTLCQTEQQLTVLVVEDNTDMRKYISSILSDYYKVMEAENGEEALVVLRSEAIDFIISDLMMSVMDGLELSRKVKADFSISHIPFLMLTAKTSMETRINSYKMGVDEFLAKPFDEELLLTRINNMLEARKTYQRKFSLLMNVSELNIVEESNDDKFLKKALKIVNENYRDAAYEISDLAEAMGVSKTLLNNKMQTLTGQSPSHFIRNFRLKIAHELIVKSKGNMNISEIAYEVGFNDPKYFTRCFTKHFGVAPSKI